MKIAKRMIITGMLAAIYLLLHSYNVNAVALQSNGNEAAKYNLSEWMLKIREMQSAGGALGLTDSIKEEDLSSLNENLDIHMEKNTEYGAMMLLSTSAYGNPNTIENGGTTTGNATGIVTNFNNTNLEWVSAGHNSLDVPNFKIALLRYKNVFNNNEILQEEHIGDAMEEVKNWHRKYLWCK